VLYTRFLKTDFLAVSHNLSGNRRKHFVVYSSYFSSNRNEIHMGGCEEPITCKLLARNTLIYEEGNTSVAVIYFPYWIFICLVQELTACTY